MPTIILKVYYKHVCDNCKKEKESFKVIPPGWVKTEHYLFHSADCLRDFAAVNIMPRLLEFLNE